MALHFFCSAAVMKIGEYVVAKIGENVVGRIGDYLLALIVDYLVAPIVDYLIAPIGRQLGYLFCAIGRQLGNLFCAIGRLLDSRFCYNGNIEDFKKQVESLKTETARVKERVRAAKQKGEDILPDVETWLTSVNNITVEANKFFNKELQVNTRFFNGRFCPNLKLRHQRSKEAKVKTTEVGELIRLGNFDSISRPKDFDSRKNVFLSQSHSSTTPAIQSSPETSLRSEAAMADNSLKDFYIPTYILVPESEAVIVPDAPKCPVIVFINSKSGGQLGGDLFVTYRSLLNEYQVFDLGKEAPDKVLRRIYLNLEKLKLGGDDLAIKIQERLRIIVAGGDGTAGLLLGVVCDLKLSKPPPIATVPLGTGNNLPFAFGWGKKNPVTDRHSVESFLEKVREAKEMKIDNWHILMRMKAPKDGSCDPIAPLEFPHSLRAFHRVSATDSLNMEGCHTFRGGFWNYFSLGMDAQVSYTFHCERKLHPERFKNQLVNQSTYAKLGLTQRWFAASIFQPSSRNIAQLAKVKIMKKSGQWQDLDIPHSIRSIVCLNLPSFSGGLNPWGTPNVKKQRDRDLTPPFVDDGLLEVVGFRDAWHGLALFAPNGHRTRLAQAHRIRFEFHKGAADHTYMRIDDGEPWKQPLPFDDDTVLVEISHLGQVNMLATHDCKSKSVHDPSTPTSHDAEDEDSDEEYDTVQDAEERRKFGAADSFRIPDEVDISHLS